MNLAHRSIVLTLALAVGLLASVGFGRADDTEWKAAHDTDPHLPLTAQQLAIMTGRRAAESPDSGAVPATFVPYSLCGSCTGGGTSYPSSASLVANQTPQATSYYCGPASDVDRVIHTGHGQGSFLLTGHLVAWPESLSRGAETRMQVASTRTGDPVPAPPALRGLHGVSGLATDGLRIAYPNGPYTSLSWSPSLTLPPRRIVRARGANHVDNSVQIGGRYIGFGIQPKIFMGDTKTRRYLEIAAHGGWTRIDRRSLLVLFAAGAKQLYAATPVSFVRLRDLPPMPACK